MHDRAYMYSLRHPMPVCFSIQGKHPAFLFVKCCFDITLNKHGIMITNTSDDLNLDNNTVVVSYKKSKTLHVISPRKIGYELD